MDSSPANPVDLKTALTARLGERSELQPRDKILLKPITGLSEKLKAAWEADLEAVVVEKDQEPRQDDAWLSATNPRSKPPTRCATIGEAWYEIHASTRHLRAYQSAIVKRWQDEWVDEVDVPETEAGESSR